MISSFAKAIGQLPDPRFRRVLVLGLLTTSLCYAAIYALAAYALATVRMFEAEWANALIDILGGVAGFVLSLSFFPSAALLSLSFLLDGIADAVEKKHYPDLPEPRRQRIGEIAWGALRFALLTLIVNVIALPVYVTLLLVGVGIGLYYVVNGYLLAREYFELVAWRRLEPKEADALFSAHSGRLWLMGIALAFLSTIPLINLLSPLVGTAAMVHEVEALRHRLASRSGK